MDAETRKIRMREIESYIGFGAARAIITDLCDRVAALEEFKARREAIDKEVAAAFEKATTPKPEYVTLDVLAKETRETAVREWFKGRKVQWRQTYGEHTSAWADVGSAALPSEITEYRVPIADADAFRAAQKKFERKADA